MKKLFLSLLIAAPAFGQSYLSPESVEPDNAHNRYLVSSTNNGQIIARAANGTLSTFISGLNGSYGIEIVGDTLYVLDGGTLKGFELNTAAQVISIPLTAASFPNGITHRGNRLFITDFTAKKIYCYDIATMAQWLYVPSMANTPNGIIYDAGGQRFLVACWGGSAKVFAIAESDSSLTQMISTTYSNIDGIAIDNQRNVYIATWSDDNIHMYDSAFSAAPITITTGCNNPADICINLLTDTLAIPSTGLNSVIFIDLSPSVGISSPVQLSQVRIFPNPASESLVISVSESALKNGKVLLSDMFGKLLFTSTLPNPTSSFDLSALAKGNYLVQIIADGFTETKKILIQ